MEPLSLCFKIKPRFGLTGLIALRQARRLALEKAFTSELTFAKVVTVRPQQLRRLDIERGETVTAN